MPRFKTGHLPDPAEVRRRRAGFHLLKGRKGLGVAPLPLKTNNRQFLPTSRGGPGILDQGQTSSCEGHAHASGITLRFAITGSAIPLVSPVCIYTCARYFARQPTPEGRFLPLTDDGTYPSMVLAGMSEWGVTSATTWGDYPADPVTINNEPTIEDLESCAEFELEGAYFLQSSGDAFCQDLMTVLAAGYPCSAAIAASSNAFQGYTGGVLGPLDDAVDHASLWIDYEWDGRNYGSLVVYGVNSWGEFQWGEADTTGIRGGMYRCNRDFVSKYSQDCAVLSVLKAAA